MRPTRGVPMEGPGTFATKGDDTVVEPRAAVALLARPRPPEPDAGRDLERVAAATALIALGLRADLRAGVTVGVVVAVLLLPVWVRAFVEYRGGVVVAGVVVLAIVNGLVLSGIARESRLVDLRNVVSNVSLFVELLVGVGVILWARRVFPDWVVAALVGVGMVAWGVLHPSGALVNAWKFDLAAPVSVLLLAFASRSRRPAVPIGTMLLLAAVSVAFDSRAYSAALLLCVVLQLWRSLPRFGRSRRSWFGVVVLVTAIAGVMYLLLTQLLVSGVLGTAAAERSQAQIDTSGSLILGGRPEIAATGALLQYHPTGFGFGVLPSYTDVNVAKAGMATLNYDPNNGYVTNFMFGNGFELHSVFGDLWALSGFSGLLLAAVSAAAAVYAIGRGIATRAGLPVLLYAAVWTLWNIPFSPLYVSVPILALLFGLVLDPRDTGAATVVAAGTGDPEPGAQAPARWRVRRASAPRPGIPSARRPGAGLLPTPGSHSRVPSSEER